MDHGAGANRTRNLCEKLLRKYNPSAFGQKTGVWSELKIKYSECAFQNDDDIDKTFDYTFDYVICSTRPKPISEIADAQGCSEQKLHFNAFEERVYDSSQEQSSLCGGIP